MREIKFRGYYADPTDPANCKWVHGYYVSRGDEHWIDCSVVSYLVDGKSVGQFTGLHDKNGKEIYEGDVLKDDLLDDLVPTILSVVWRNNIAGFAAKEIPNDAWLLVRQGHYEVIGNIYEHGDLLK